jgi:phosphoribosylanthranilate isomerase
MTWVKICGITNLEDALTAVEAGADALGFVFYEKSPRNVLPETVREIVRRTPAEIEKVGVFVNESPDLMESVAERLGLTAIQVHIEMSDLGNKKSQRIMLSKHFRQHIALPARHFLDEKARFDNFALSMKSNESDDQIRAIFLDSGTPEQPGGTGHAFDWDNAVPVAEVIRQAGFDLVVAGGLTPANVTEAIRILKPWGVDVSSGVESTPGKKDPKKIRAFVAAVRRTERVV